MSRPIMIRPLEFRAWCLDKKEMYTGFTFEDIYAGRDEMEVSCDDGKSFDTWKNKIIMQSTGLKDNSGVTIYEADILGNVECPKHLFRGPYLVEWKKSHWVLKDPGQSEDVWYEEMWKNWAWDNIYVGYGFNQLKIVGNIYENQELLE